MFTRSRTLFDHLVPVLKAGLVDDELNKDRLSKRYKLSPDIVSEVIGDAKATASPPEAPTSLGEEMLKAVEPVSKEVAALTGAPTVESASSMGAMAPVTEGSEAALPKPGFARRHRRAIIVVLSALLAVASLYGLKVIP